MLCFRKIPVAKKFMDKREGEVSRFPFKFFYLKASKNAVEEPFSLSLSSGIEKVRIGELGEGGGESQDFQSILSCLKVPKHFVEEPFYAVFQNFPVAKTFLYKSEGEVSRVSFEKLLSHSAEKIRRGTL